MGSQTCGVDFKQGSASRYRNLVSFGHKESRLSTTVNVVFWLLALALSLFHGLAFASVFSMSTSGKGWAWKLHQFWLNFLGSLVGWIAFWFLFRSVIECAEGSCPFQFGWTDVGMFFLAFLGVTGYVPFTVIGLASGVKELATKVAGLAK